MPRIGYTTTRDPYGAGTTNGEGTFMQNFFATNLTTWTVSALESFGTGNTENNYFVLTQGAHEILVAIPNGYQQSYADQIEVSARVTNDTEGNGALSFGYANGGGYAASFVGGLDPSADAAFFPTDSTPMKTIDDYDTGAGTLNLYLIENDDYPELIFMVSSGTVYPSMWAFSENCFDLTRTPLAVTPEFTWQTQGVAAFDPGVITSGVPSASRTYQWVFAPEKLDGPYQGEQYPGFFGAITGIDDAHFPIAGDYSSRRMPLAIVIPQDGPDYGQFINFDQRFMREWPNLLTPYGRRFLGGAPEEVFTFILRGYLHPWATDLGDPVTP